MALTPQDIQSQQFHVRFRGFDVDEVDDFLEKIAEDYLTSIQENKQLKERLEEMKKDLSTYRGQEKSFQKAFVSAQQIADQMKEESKKEAAEILEQASREAERLIADTHQEISDLEQQLDQLKAQKNAIREELRATLIGYLDRLNEVDEATAARTPSVEFESSSETDETENVLEDSFPEDLANEETEEELTLDAADAEEEADAEDDLYEKVDLTDDFRLPEEDELQDFGDEARAIYASQDKEEAEDAMPDLEGEMVFSLDDPLDDLAPDIQIRDAKPASK